MANCVDQSISNAGPEGAITQHILKVAEADPVRVSDKVGREKCQIGI